MDGEDSNRGSAALHPLKMQLLNNVVGQPAKDLPRFTSNMCDFTAIL